MEKHILILRQGHEGVAAPYNYENRHYIRYSRIVKLGQQIEYLDLLYSA